MPAATKEKIDVYGIVTERVMGQLEKGTVLWHQPWRNLGGAGQHRNLVTKRAYRGINVFLLSMQGYADPWWATINQINKLGGRVAKGEKPTIVSMWKPIEVAPEPGYTGRLNEKGKKTIFLLRYHKVWNVEQTTGLEAWVAKNRPAPDELEEPEQSVKEVQAAKVLEQYRRRYDIKLRHAGDSAFYAPSRDSIGLPARAAFEDGAAYVSTSAHEHVHSTGHKDRLDRDDLTKLASTFGAPSYAREELVAEMGAAMYLARHRLDTPQREGQSAAYIDHWLQALANDRKLVVSAAARASNAVDMLMNETRKEFTRAPKKEAK